MTKHASFLFVVLLSAMGSLSPLGPATAQSASSAAETIKPGELRTMGNPKAKVVLIEYGALVCPDCADFNQQVFPELKRRYIDTGKVFFVYRLFPLDIADFKAEKIASCLPPARYFDFLSQLYRRQREWGPEQMRERGFAAQPLTDAGLLDVAQDAGLSPEKAEACMRDDDIEDRINDVGTEGLTRYELDGTPTFIVNGQVQAMGTRSLAQLQALIDPILAGR